MSSGYGSHGTKGRCYDFWVDFKKCAQTEGSDLKLCAQLREDYWECLHHKKQAKRLYQLEQEMKNQKAAANASS
eukprot:TRINITY_DN492_c0_g1_i2.p1 TRINITY_DN492_c0_g1~~TRINITY_DN492_c0_g1_i2.p1  ORF type:complete len:74 (+),score=17.08 TRINITY_DN492_c0_g1_i2:120-341(+)